MRGLIAWILYWIGDAACKIMELGDDSERWVGFWYPVYNWLMTTSNDVQGDEEGPWEHK